MRELLMRSQPGLQWSARRPPVSCPNIAKVFPFVLTSRGMVVRPDKASGMADRASARRARPTDSLGATNKRAHNPPQGPPVLLKEGFVSTGPTPFFVEAGAGPGVVCLHANASTSSQWRSLMALLAPRFHVLAPDGHGAGKGPAWPTDRMLCLRDEVDLIAPVLNRAGASPVLVGHSYGAAVALVAAVMHPDRFRALVLYEPTLFALLDAESPPPNEADGIRQAVAAAGAALDAGDADAAAGHFIDFWMGEGAWQRTPGNRRGPIAESVRNVRGWAAALTHEPTPLSLLTRLDLPVLLMSGNVSPVSSLAVARLLAGAMPRVRTISFEGVGHMGPLTHSDLVNAAIARFLHTLDQQEESTP